MMRNGGNGGVGDAYDDDDDEQEQEDRDVSQCQLMHTFIVTRVEQAASKMGE